VKIGILGTAAHFAKAPFNDPSWELWACNNGEPPRWDRWFQLHDDGIIDSFPGYRDWLRAQTKPVYMQTRNTSVPEALAYPLDAIRAKYGDWFLSSTIAFMLALAIEEGPEEIGIWGVDMADASEYRYQKPGCRFFIQAARMQGIKVTVPPESDLLTPGLVYGYEPKSWLRMKAEAKRDEMAGRIADINGQRQALVLETAALRGALGITIPREDMEKRLAQIAASEADLALAAATLDGGCQLAEYVLQNWTGEHQ
jgi:hypothetical protein